MAQFNGQATQAGLAAATSANGTARNGATLTLNKVQPGTLSVALVSAITTASVVATFTAQVSRDGTTWYAVKLTNNAAVVDSAAGTGSAVTTRTCMQLTGLEGWPYFRVVALLSGATTAAADQTTVDYVYVAYGRAGAI